MCAQQNDVFHRVFSCAKRRPFIGIFDIFDDDISVIGVFWGIGFSFGDRLVKFFELIGVMDAVGVDGGLCTDHKVFERDFEIAVFVADSAGSIDALFFAGALYAASTAIIPVGEGIDVTAFASGLVVVGTQRHLAIAGGLWTVFDQCAVFARQNYQTFGVVIAIRPHIVPAFTAFSGVEAILGIIAVCRIRFAGIRAQRCDPHIIGFIVAGLNDGLAIFDLASLGWLVLTARRAFQQTVLPAAADVAEAV